MPRNEPKPLDQSDALRQRLNLNSLGPALSNGTVVTVAYTKRDGTVSSSTGVPVFVNGKPGFDTGSVTIATEDKGNRTVNLHRIHSITL